jgi:hypothetical protein
MCECGNHPSAFLIYICRYMHTQRHLRGTLGVLHFMLNTEKMSELVRKRLGSKGDDALLLS